MTKPAIRSVRVRPSHLPALTLSGVVWSPGFDNKHRSCEDCAMLEVCADAVDAGNFAGCEGVIEDELWHVQDQPKWVPQMKEGEFDEQESERCFG